MATCLQRWQRANLSRGSIDFRLSHSLVILRRLCFQWAMAFLQLCCLSIPSIGTLQSNTHMHTVLHHFKDSNSKKNSFVVVRLGPQIRLALPWQSRYDAGTRWVSGKSWKLINQMRLYRLYTGLGCVVGWENVWSLKAGFAHGNKEQESSGVAFLQVVSASISEDILKAGEAKELS